MTGNNNDEEAKRSQAEEAQLETMVKNALAEVARGATPEAVLGQLLTTLPAPLHETLKRRLSAALDRDRRKNLGLKQLTVLMARQTFERIVAMLSSKPEIASRVKEAGNALLRNGVVPDLNRVSEADLGNLSPGATVGKGREQETQR